MKKWSTQAHARAMATGLVALATLALMAACSDDSSPGASPSADGICAVSINDSIRLSLEPTCGSCHQATSGKPFFASLAAFEDLLVYDVKYIEKGKPDSGLFIELLEGRARGAYAQMPTAGPAFAALAEQGKTKINVAAIKAWIRDLPPLDASRSGPNISAATSRRLHADEFARALSQTLGFPVAAALEPPSIGGPLNLLSPDAPIFHPKDAYDYGPYMTLYQLLGGAHTLAGTAAEKTWTSGSMTAVTQLASSACQNAVAAKTPKLFKHAAPSMTLATNASEIKKNLAQLVRDFLHTPTDEAFNTRLLEQVYAPLEAKSTEAAWTGVCSVLVRDPRFLTF
jgi:hypothetical protein